jgi:hypothetical protein
MFSSRSSFLTRVKKIFSIHFSFLQAFSPESLRNKKKMFSLVFVNCNNYTGN